MKTKFKVNIVILLIICLFFTFAFLGCDSDNGSDSGGGNSNTNNQTDIGDNQGGAGDQGDSGNSGNSNGSDNSEQKDETEYEVTFKADGETVAIKKYTESNKTVEEPGVPQKAGYTGAWEAYTLTGNVTVNAVYTLTEYNVTFKADGETVAIKTYTVENKTIEEPSVPDKAGYSGAWESYTLTTGSVTVNAVYSMETYTVTFMADSVTVGTRTYNVENAVIDEPEVPLKSDYYCAWEDYSLNFENVTVEALYVAAEGFEYTLNPNNISYTITGYTGSSEKIYVPQQWQALFVTGIGAGAFANCTFITDIVVPDTVSDIGAAPFAGCNKLKNLTVPFIGDCIKNDSETYQYPLGYFFGTESYTGGVQTRQSYYKSSLKTASNEPFYIPSSLKSVTVTGGNILRGAFQNCKNIESITLPAGITSINNSALRFCESLTNIVIPETVESIEQYAFDSCKNLTAVNIPVGVDRLLSYTFSNCRKLADITYGGTVAEWEALVKGDYWDNNNCSYTVHCSDGDVFVDKTAA